MQKMKSGFPVLACFSLLLLAGCSTTNQPRLNTDIRAVRYNDLVWEHYPYPLRVEYDGKRLTLFPNEYDANTRFFVTKNLAPKFIAAIDKYLEWEKTATERGDQITKTIDRIPYLGSRMTARFHSGNPREHYISFGIRSPVLGDNFKIDGLSDLILDRKNAQEFRELLAKFRDGKVEIPNVDEIYR